MAFVDFSNAKLEIDLPSGTSPQNIWKKELGLYGGTGNWKYLFDVNKSSITDYTSTQLISYTAEAMAVVYYGKFTTSGTEAYIQCDGGSQTWKISNISFEAGDMYCFSITAVVGQV